MIAEHGEKLDTILQQVRVWFLELPAIVLGRSRTFVDVVPDHQHEGITESLAERHHLRRDFKLRTRAAAAVANHRKLHGRGAVREYERARTERADGSRPNLRAGAGLWVAAAGGRE